MLFVTYLFKISSKYPSEPWPRVTSSCQEARRESSLLRAKTQTHKKNKEVALGPNVELEVKIITIMEERNPRTW